MKRVQIGRSDWYWVESEAKAYKCQYAALHQAMPANGEVKDVIEYNGMYLVKYGKKFVRIG